MSSGGALASRAGRPRAARASTSPGISRSGATRARNASRSACVGSVALEHQVPDVLDRALLREVDGVVLAVVVEALEAAYVADVGLGDDHALEPARDLVGEVLGRLDLRDAHEVAHRDDADDLVVVDHRDVAVAVLGEARERGGDVDVGARRSPGSAVIHSLTVAVPGVAAGGGDPHEVALGQDADRAARRRPRRPSPTRCSRIRAGGLGHLVVGTRPSRRGAHDVADRAGLAVRPGAWTSLPRRRWAQRESSRSEAQSVRSIASRPASVAVFGRDRSYVLSRAPCRPSPATKRSTA